MTLRNYQASLTLSNLYEINLINGGKGIGEALSPRITAKGGSIDIYYSDSATQPSALADMALIKEDTLGQSFVSVPRYIAIVQNTGTVTETIVSCIEIVEDLGAIA